MISIQHQNHKVTLERTDAGVSVGLYLGGKFVSGTLVTDQPFHVVADRAYGWVRQRTWPEPADLVHLNP